MLFVNMQSLARLVRAPGIRALSGNVVGYGRPVAGTEATAALVSSGIRHILLWKRSRASSGNNGSDVEVAMKLEDSTEAEYPMQKQLLMDHAKKYAGIDCLQICGATSIWCDADDTVEDALMELMNLDPVTISSINAYLRTEKPFFKVVITANVTDYAQDQTVFNIILALYKHHAKHALILSGGSEVLLDMVDPKVGVITLSPDTELWRAKELINGWTIAFNIVSVE